MKKQAIIVNGLSKKYTISHLQKDSYVTLKDELVRMAKKPLQLIGSSHGMEKETFWALKDINFEVNPGEVVGVVGRNGSGKSTLFKILSRITHPSEGQAILHGRTSSLLEVGTGFNPELTGRENVYFNGAILGMRKKEIDQKFASIVDFSEIEKFIDTQVKYYSSGMKVRLGFAVAAHLDPEILLIDEVLAVGDANFKRKSLAKMQEIAGRGTTVLFVSHVMSQIQKICTRGILLDRGRIAFKGEVDEVSDLYLGQNKDVLDEDKELFGQTTNFLILKPGVLTNIADIDARGGTGQIKFTAISYQLDKKATLATLNFKLQISNLSNTGVGKLRVGIGLTDLLGNDVVIVSNTSVKQPISIGKNDKNKVVEVSLKGINIAPGTYRIKLYMSPYDKDDVVFDHLKNFAEFELENYNPIEFNTNQKYGLISLPAEYKIK